MDHAIVSPLLGEVGSEIAERVALRRQVPLEPRGVEDRCEVRADSTPVLAWCQRQDGAGEKDGERLEKEPPPHTRRRCAVLPMPVGTLLGKAAGTHVGAPPQTATPTHIMCPARAASLRRTRPRRVRHRGRGLGAGGRRGRSEACGRARRGRLFADILEIERGEVEEKTSQSVHVARCKKKVSMWTFYPNRLVTGS